jgi:hypothetical protein
MQKCEVNNQRFRSELQKRIQDDQRVTYVPEGTKLTMLCEGRVVFTASRTLLGLHSHRTVSLNDPEVLAGGIAPGTYHSWMWPWTIFDDDPRSQEIKPEVDKMTELDHHRKDFSMFQDAIVLRYILAVLCNHMGYEHVLPISPEGHEVDHIFGLRDIQYASLAESSTNKSEALKKD